MHSRISSADSWGEETQSKKGLAFGKGFLLNSLKRINSFSFFNKKAFHNCKRLFLIVGVAGFEPTTSCSQSRRDTGLRYTPKIYFFHLHKLTQRPSRPKSGRNTGLRYTPKIYFFHLHKLTQ